MNLILNCDTYKSSHWTFRPPGLENNYGYIEARKGGNFNEVMFFGLQYFLNTFMKLQVTSDMVAEADAFLSQHGVPFDRRLWETVVRKHKGYLPVSIRALPEGYVVPHGMVLATVEDTDPECAGVSSWVETQLLRAIWYPTTIATRSMRWYRLINAALEKTGTPELAEFKLVDFGARGTHSTESAAIGGAAHLVNFQVTDNLLGIMLSQSHYNTGTMTGFSIPATEHSVTTSWGPDLSENGGPDNELRFFEHILATYGDKVNPLGGRYPVSVVIDTYDQDRALQKWGTILKDRLVNSNMQLVARPDSGDPVANLMHVLELLGRYFGTETNDKGFRVLPDCVRVIQGDGINEDSLRRILLTAENRKWSIDNIAFGSGGGLLVHEAERDTHSFALKTSEVTINGQTTEIRKVVKTDPTKASKAGRFAVVLPKYSAQLQLINERDLDTNEYNYLREVYRDGQLLNEQTFDEVRENARSSFGR